MVYVELGIVMLLWGLVPLVMQWSSHSLHAGSFNLIRYGMAVIFIAVYMMAKRERFALPVSTATKLLLLGAGTMFPFSYFFLLGVKNVDISIAGMIQGTTPALTILVTATVFSQRPSNRVIACITTTYVGLLIFLLGSPMDRMGTISISPGIVYVVVAIFCLAVYTSLSKSASLGLNMWLVTFYVCLGVCAACLPIAVYEFWWLGGQNLGPRGVAGTVYMSLFATVISLMLYTKAIRSVGPFQASIVTNLVPVVIVASDIFVLNKHIGAVQVAALLLTLTGVYLTVRFDWQGKEGRRPVSSAKPPNQKVSPSRKSESI